YSAWCYSFVCSIAFAICVVSSFGKAVCVDFWSCVFSQKYSWHVCRTCRLISFVYIHLVNENLDITVKLQRIRFMSDRYISTVPTALTTVVLIPRDRNRRNVECFCTQPVNIRCLKLICKH